MRISDWSSDVCSSDLKMPGRARPYLRRAVGVILQDTHLLYDRNAINNVLLPLAVVGLETRQAGTRARAAMEKVGLSGKEDLTPIEMSGAGQQRPAQFRKRCGSGKSESVGVRLGGRRRLK